MYPFLIQSLKGRFSEKSWKSLTKVNRIIEIPEGDYGSLQFEGDDEFIYEGNLYDIIQQKKENGKIIFYCYHDKEEETAKKDYHNNLNNKKKENINQINHFTFYAVIESFNSSNISVWKSASFMLPFQNYVSFISDIPIPPPRLT